MAFTLKKLEFSACLPGDDDTITSILRQPTAVEEGEFLKARLEYSSKRGDIIDNGLDVRCELYDILVQDIVGKYQDGDELKDFSNDNPIPQEILARFCENTGRIMSDKSGWQMKDLIPPGYKQSCILTVIENIRVEDNLKKKL